VYVAYFYARGHARGHARDPHDGCGKLEVKEVKKVMMEVKEVENPDDWAYFKCIQQSPYE
jgi:hypothetical protein